MNSSTPHSASTTFPSAQHNANGEPRFHVPADPNDPLWADAADREAAGGIAAEVRAFLDAQLETGDVLLDLAPGIGVVALAATTAPGGMPTVFVADLAPERFQQLQDAAIDVGGWIEPVTTDQTTDLAALADARLDSEGRVFVHVRAIDVPRTIDRLRALFTRDRVLAVCIPDAHDSAAWPDAERALQGADLVACQMAEQHGEAVLQRLTTAPRTPVIALPTFVAPTAQAPSVDDDLFPAPTTSNDTSTSPRHGAMPIDMSTRWSATRDGISLIAPYTRTGYGVAGAHLLRALQQQDVPVAFFPIGAVDETITNNPRLRDALTLQAAFRPDVPSVRMAQQFDLAMHVGRGPHIAFPIFERDRFDPRERHHLASQDAVIVCSQWARTVCLDNDLRMPIHVVPLGCDRAVFNESVVPSRRWTETVFMQVGKLETRKGQRELLLAFEAAFTQKDDVRLVLVCANPFMSRMEFDALLKPFKQSPMASKITLVTTEVPSQHDVAALMAAADCGVFAARAEGWNLEALEMLSMAKPVIATNYSAHTEYLNAHNARLITIDRQEDAKIGQFGGRWAAWDAAQHEQLVAELRAVHDARQQGALAPNRAGIDTAVAFSWDTSATALTTAIDALA